ncbi:MAG: 2-amino-4-hydroxy-6-hydroxymethyldihydropteridine diphosphokinase [Deltaproteobacteria bacterium]|nr:2-amino-4-hydroxy-6-hydroxymethyldihydropteridine diphosphokinase [Deltaproteobacteria bacterium]
MNQLFLSLGSNLGNRYENIRKAAYLLNSNNICISTSSSLYETKPYGIVHQPNFLNVVFKCISDLEPTNLLRTIKNIEMSIGRSKNIRWGPRIIDIDILLYDNLIVKTDELTIPHSELKKRDFFLVPLLEIDSNIIDPETGLPLKKFIPKTSKNIIHLAPIELELSKI